MDVKLCIKDVAQKITSISLASEALCRLLAIFFPYPSANHHLFPKRLFEKKLRSHIARKREPSKLPRNTHSHRDNLFLCIHTWKPDNVKETLFFSSRIRISLKKGGEIKAKDAVKDTIEKGGEKEKRFWLSGSHLLWFWCAPSKRREKRAT